MTAPKAAIRAWGEQLLPAKPSVDPGNPAYRDFARLGFVIFLTQRTPSGRRPQPTGSTRQKSRSSSAALRKFQEGARKEKFLRISRTLCAQLFAHSFTQARAIHSSRSAKKVPVRHALFLTPGLILRTPHPTPVLRRCCTHHSPCTTHVAVTYSPLDRTKTSRLKSECAKIFFAKFSTRQKCFVLVCRLFYFQKFSFVQAFRSRETGGALH
jgi:hypothetical protein